MDIAGRLSGFSGADIEMQRERMKTNATCVLLFVALMMNWNFALAYEVVAASTKALEDAQRMAECMSKFDAKCWADYSYLEAIEQRGYSTSEIRQHFEARVKDMSDKAKATGQEMPQISPSLPSQIYQGDGKLYAFLPYKAEMTKASTGQRSAFQAFLVGISTDAGKSWKFVDGVRLTPASMKTVMPSYAGQQLPPVGPLN